MHKACIARGFWGLQFEVLVSKSAIKEVGFRGVIMKGQWVRVRVGSGLGLG